MRLPELDLPTFPVPDEIQNLDFAEYRKKPVVVRAAQATHSGVIHTLEGIMAFHPGDWIIQGVKGEIYPCRDDIFQATYDRVPEYDPDDPPAAHIEFRS